MGVRVNGCGCCRFGYPAPPARPQVTPGRPGRQHPKGFGEVGLPQRDLPPQCRGSRSGGRRTACRGRSGITAMGRRGGGSLCEGAGALAVRQLRGCGAYQCRAAQAQHAMPADAGWFGGRGGVLVGRRLHTQRRTDLVQWGIGRVGGQGRRGDGRRQRQRPPDQYPRRQRTGAAQVVEQ